MEIEMEQMSYPKSSFPISEDRFFGGVYIPSTEMNKFSLKESDIKIKALIIIGKCSKFHRLKKIELLL